MNNDEIFFIIDSNKLDSVHEKLYGYKIINSHYKTNLEDNFQEYGHFIDIKLDNNYIYITQDYLASWGIYIFKDKEYFAISNSFIMLAEYLKNYFKLSFNYDYANALFAQGLIVTAYKETMINEISILPSNAKIIIEKKSKNIIIDLQNIRFNYIDIDSYESIKIIDTWFLKWINFIKCIKEKTNKIRIDLSGGIDSRITFLLALKSNINLNDIQIYSAKDDLHTHKEDFEIANNICNFYNIKINNKLNNSYHHLSMKDSIENSFRIKLCFHNQMYYKTSYCIEPIFRFSGGGGETLRNYWNESSIKSMISAASKISNQMGISVNKIISNSFQALNVDNFQNDISPMFFYRAIRARNHFGKSAVEDFIANIFTIMPLLDPLIQKIKFRHIDNNLLAALIFKRYEEKLLDFKFDSNRKIDNKCLSIASKINNKFPFNKNTFIQQNYNIISHKNKPNIKKIQKTNRSEIEQFLRKIIYTNDFKNLTSLIFSNDVYDDVVVFSDKKIFSPLSKFISVLASILVYKIVILSKSQHLTTYDLLTYFFNIDKNIEINKYKNFCDAFATIRIDIKNKGLKSNNVKVIFKEYPKKVEYPKWFSNNDGYGVVIESFAGKLTFKLICIGDGALTISLRGVDIRDRNNTRLPIFINCTSFSIDERKILSCSKLISHDKPYKYICNVLNKDILNIDLEWKPVFPQYSKY